MRRTNLKKLFRKTEGMVSFREVSFLYDLAKHITDTCIVEIGAYRGRSTAALARGSIDGHEVPVFVIEPHEDFSGILGGTFGASDRGAFFKAMLELSCSHIVRLINLSSGQVAPSWNRKIGLLWIDGDHAYGAVKRDFALWSPHLESNGLIAFHDARDPRLGPYTVLNEILSSGAFEKVGAVDEIVTVKRKTS